MIARLLLSPLVVAALAPAAAAETAGAPDTGGAGSTPGLGVSVGPLDFAMHGYFRAPLRLGFRGRDSAKEGEAGYNVHTPWLVDDDYFRSGFAYTRIQESDWSELYFSAGNKHLRGEVALMGSLFSDWARPLLDRQWGISQGSLSYFFNTEGPRGRFRLQVKGGAFWDRFGWLENYDTYMFGRTHQLGGQVRMEFERDRWTFTLLQGVGAHLEAIDANQGLTLLNYLHAGVRYRRVVEAGFYFLDARTQDQRQLKELSDASMQVYGLEARLHTVLLGRLNLFGSIIKASQAKFLAPAIEVLHAFGGTGLTENYFGTESSKNGTGSLWSLAFEHDYSFRALLQKVAPDSRARVRQGDLRLRWFGLLTYTLSEQVSLDPLVNRDGVLAFKWGTEASWQALSWLALALRYDRVILDVQDDADSFRIVTPRIILTTRWLLGGQIFLQYSRYFYGERVRLRPGQVALETQPDTDVLKIQAQLVF